jgi:hypothetical protein|tara:strand:+ start:290 stop:571 length:282 start_codon:yes stop_codon:yes gene_type:complete
MKPQLVDLNDIFKDQFPLLKKKHEIKKKKMITKNINYDFNYNSLFNFLGLVCLVIGLYFLSRRKQDKEKRKVDFEGRIYKLKDIIKSNDGFIL